MPWTWLSKRKILFEIVSVETKYCPLGANELSERTIKQTRKDILKNKSHLCNNQTIKPSKGFYDQECNVNIILHSSSNQDCIFLATNMGCSFCISLFFGKPTQYSNKNVGRMPWKFKFLNCLQFSPNNKIYINKKQWVISRSERKAVSFKNTDNPNSLLRIQNVRMFEKSDNMELNNLVHCI